MQSRFAGPRRFPGMQCAADPGLDQSREEPGFVGAIDGLLHTLRSRVAVFTRVLRAEGDVFGGDFNEADSRFHEAAGDIVQTVYGLRPEPLKPTVPLLK